MPVKNEAYLIDHIPKLDCSRAGYVASTSPSTNNDNFTNHTIPIRRWSCNINFCHFDASWLVTLSCVVSVAPATLAISFATRDTTL